MVHWAFQLCKKYVTLSWFPTGATQGDQAGRQLKWALCSSWQSWILALPKPRSSDVPVLCSYQQNYLVKCLSYLHGRIHVYPDLNIIQGVHVLKLHTILQKYVKLYVFLYQLKDKFRAGDRSSVIRYLSSICDTLGFSPSTGK